MGHTQPTMVVGLQRIVQIRGVVSAIDLKVSGREGSQVEGRCVEIWMRCSVALFRAQILMGYVATAVKILPIYLMSTQVHMNHDFSCHLCFGGQ